MVLSSTKAPQQHISTLSSWKTVSFGPSFMRWFALVNLVLQHDDSPTAHRGMEMLHSVC